MKVPALASALALANLCPAQPLNYIYWAGVPTNLALNLTGVWTAPDPWLPDAFIALMPILPQSNMGIPQWATFESPVMMNTTFGTGNWLGCRMTAIEWAYITDSACAHQPAAGGTAPRSLLTSSYDFGGYTGIVGVPFTPLPNSSLFQGNFASAVYPFSSGFDRQYWQLITRGYFGFDQWNACAPSLSITPQFGGFLVARFRVVFQ